MKVSGCCNREIIRRQEIEYPLGGRVWRQVYSFDACISCGMEVTEYVETCEECGEVSCECREMPMRVLPNGEVIEAEEAKR